MKKYYILAFTLLCLLMGQSSVAQDWQDLGLDAQTTAILQQFEDAGVEIKAYTDTQTYINDVNNDSNPNNDFIDYNGDGTTNTADMTLLIAMSDADLNATLALTTQLHEVVVFNYYHDPIKYIYYNLDYTNPFVLNDICSNYPAYCYFQNVPLLEGSFSITDSNNPNRTVSNGQTLVMVNSGSARQASMDMTTSFGGDVTWSGNGVTGNNSSATYSGTNSTSVIASCASSGIGATGNIQIVNENKISYASKIDGVKTKINDMAENIKAFVESKTSGSKISESSKFLTLSGTIESKNVDMYADGTKYGNATSFDLKGTLTQTMPTIRIPIYSIGAINMFAELNLGSATGSIDIKGALDDSTAAKAEIQGGIEIGFNAVSGSVMAIIGDPEHLCGEAKGSIVAEAFKYSGTLMTNTDFSGVLLTPTLKLGKISAPYSVSAKINIGTANETCTFISGTYKIWEGEDFPLTPVLLYQKS
ncbi:hypothetical protein EOD40_16230 [Flavobacterium sufflavum]|uniref:Uncharacterized protein n=1 Tax=Flavobacterium sufflavum TaxID=1921138 RepID=A0A3S2UF76_9FLAO|nr:hypothetical protein [Flavobacterium sufflavum]RVT71967.1 hypothetical protein EOD40_16230 [Flavobacterium sufflavum]